MKIQSFIKRLNATELGLGVTHDAYIAIPSDVDLSVMLENQKVLHPVDKASGYSYTPSGSEFKYVQTGQNNQKRISGLGEFYASRDAKVGDEILVEKVQRKSGTVEYYIDLIHRNAIVFQVNSIKGRKCVEILPNSLIEGYANGKDYAFRVNYKGIELDLLVEFIEETNKKKTSPQPTKFYDLLIDGKSIMPEYNYQEYIEILTNDMRLERMKTYWYSILEMGEENNG